MKKVVYFVFTFLLSSVLILSQGAIAADGDSTLETPADGASYELDKGALKSCITDGKADQSLCGANQECIVIPSTLYDEEPVAVCTDYGMEYCKTNQDCTTLGKNTCVLKLGSNALAENYDMSSNVGICVARGGSGESNAFAQAICNLMNVVTGNAGRAVVGVVVIVVGIMFFLGKVSWSLVLAVALGAGAMFGAPAIVSVITGKQFRC